MGMSSSYSADLAVIKSAGSTLKSTRDTIKHNAVLTELSGAGDSHQVVHALHDYNDDWENALTRLAHSIGNLGDRVSEAAKTYETHDHDWSNVWGQRSGKKGS